MNDCKKTNFADFIKKMIESNKNVKYYNTTIHYMQEAEDISNIIQSNSKFNDPEVEFFRIICDLKNGINDITNTIIDTAELRSVSGAFEKRANSKANTKLAEFYKSIGNILNETGILNSLLNRANRFYTQNNISFFNIDKATALEEFNKSDSNMEVMFTKISFYINKLCKYMDYIIYNKNYENDLKNEKVPQGEMQGKYLSKLKTDFINNIYREYLKDSNLDRDVILEKAEEEYSDIYKNIFGSYYKEIDLKKDLEDMENFNFIKNTMYSFKNACSTYALAILINKKESKKMASTIYTWGLTRDDNNKLVFGVELKGYPMPITLHINNKYLAVIYDRLKSKSMLYSSSINIPKYEVLRTDDNNVVHTNLLHKASSTQKETLNKRATDNKNDKRKKTNSYLQRINRLVNESNQYLNQISFNISADELEK